MSSVPVRLFLSGDLMLGRGIDQILPHPSEPQLYEPFVTDAREYVRLAEARNGEIGRPASFAYVWGDALNVLEQAAADIRIVNLETSVTTSDDHWPGKGINYRMHPRNLPCLTAAGIDCCVIANNHTLDWGREGLTQTQQDLRRGGILTAGAGSNAADAARPAVIEVGGQARVLIFGYSSETSGTPRAWAATSDRPGMNVLSGHPDRDYAFIAAHLAQYKRENDIAVVSIHWGDNWGYAIPAEEMDLAHRLIDAAGADLLYGHSSHHPKGLEVHAGRLVLYGCGDLLNDYEGIGGREHYRGDLSIMYFATLDGATGELMELEMIPMRIRKFRLERASGADSAWLQQRLDRECRKLGGAVALGAGGKLVLRGCGRERAAEK